MTAADDLLHNATVEKVLKKAVQVATDATPVVKPETPAVAATVAKPSPPTVSAETPTTPRAVVSPPAKSSAPAETHVQSPPPATAPAKPLESPKSAVEAKPPAKPAVETPVTPETKPPAKPAAETPAKPAAKPEPAPAVSKENPPTARAATRTEQMPLSTALEQRDQALAKFETAKQAAPEDTATKLIDSMTGTEEHVAAQQKALKTAATAEEKKNIQADIQTSKTALTTYNKEFAKIDSANPVKAAFLEMKSADRAVSEAQQVARRRFDSVTQAPSREAAMEAVKRTGVREQEAAAAQAVGVQQQRVTATEAAVSVKGGEGKTFLDEEKKAQAASAALQTETNQGKRAVLQEEKAKAEQKVEELTLKNAPLESKTFKEAQTTVQDTAQKLKTETDPTKQKALQEQQATAQQTVNELTQKDAELSKSEKPNDVRSVMSSRQELKKAETTLTETSSVRQELEQTAEAKAPAKDVAKAAAAREKAANNVQQRQAEASVPLNETQRTDVATATERGAATSDRRKEVIDKYTKVAESKTATADEKAAAKSVLANIEIRDQARIDKTAQRQRQGKFVDPEEVSDAAVLKENVSTQATRREKEATAQKSPNSQTGSSSSAQAEAAVPRKRMVLNNGLQYQTEEATSAGPQKRTVVRNGLQMTEDVPSAAAASGPKTRTVVRNGFQMTEDVPTVSKGSGGAGDKPASASKSKGSIGGESVEQSALQKRATAAFEPYRRGQADVGNSQVTQSLAALQKDIELIKQAVLAP